MSREGATLVEGGDCVTKVTISPKFHSFECINVDLFTSIRAMLMFEWLFSYVEFLFASV